jgi:hypothetical protein
MDMSEYMEKHSVARLIGAPPGYVGYDEGGALTEAVRRRPYQVILFDEIEKAHPDVFNVLLQVLDDGRLTDGQGHTVDFRNTLIVMTSNLGADYLVNQPDGQDTEAVKDQVMAVVRVSFRPEFLNHVDEIILFHRFKREHMGHIVDIQRGTCLAWLYPPIGSPHASGKSRRRRLQPCGAYRQAYVDTQKTLFVKNLSILEARKREFCFTFIPLLRECQLARLIHGYHARQTATTACQC